MPFAIRETLHERTARVHRARPSPRPIDLHSTCSPTTTGAATNAAKKREYLGRAGDAAQAAYANAAAIDYFERLAPLVEGPARAETLLRLGEVLELVGDWRRAAEVDAEALALAEDAGDSHAQARAEIALAEVARKTGAFDEARDRARTRARSRSTPTGDDAASAACCTSCGTIAAQRGDYDAARRELPREPRDPRATRATRRSMAALLSNLGIVAEYEGDYERSREHHERALELRTEIGDRWALGVSQTNLGMIASLQGRHEEARERFRESIRLGREVGDGWMVAIGLNNLGNAERELGAFDAARANYAASLRANEATTTAGRSRSCSRTSAASPR